MIVAMTEPFSQRRSGGLSGGEWCALAGALLLGAALRFFQLGTLRGYDLDEAHMILLAQGSWRDVLVHLQTDAYPPVFLFILNVATQLWGVQEAATRAFSAVIGTLSIALIFVVGRRAAGARVGVLAAVIMSAAPLHVFFSREARMYALLVFWALAAFYFWIRAMEENRPKLWVGLGVFLLLAAYTHSFGVLFFAAAAVALFHPSHWPRFKPLAVTLASCTALYLPWVPILIKQTRTGGEAWMSAFFEALPPWAAVLRSLEVLGAGGLYPVTNYALAYFSATRWFAAPLYAAALALFFWRGAADRERFSFKFSTLIFLLAPLLIPWLYSLLVKPVYVVGRYDVMVIGFYILALAAGAASLPRFFPTLLTAAFLVFSGFSLWPMFTRSPQMPALDRAAYITARALSTDVVYHTDIIGETLRIEFLKTKTPLDVCAFPREIDLHPGWVNYDLLSPERVEQEALQLVFFRAREGRRIWVVLGTDNFTSKYLLGALQTRFQLDPVQSSPPLSIYCFVPRK